MNLHIAGGYGMAWCGMTYSQLIQDIFLLLALETARAAVSRIPRPRPKALTS